MKKLVEQIPDFVLNTQGQILFAKPSPMRLAKDAKIGTISLKPLHPIARAF